MAAAGVGVGASLRPVAESEDPPESADRGPVNFAVSAGRFTAAPLVLPTVGGDAVARASFAADLAVEPDVLFQDPADGLIAASERLDLLVMGSAAHGPARAVALSGVTRKVTASAGCPVLVLPRDAASQIEALLPHTEPQAAQRCRSSRRGRSAASLRAPRARLGGFGHRVEHRVRTDRVDHSTAPPQPENRWVQAGVV